MNFLSSKKCLLESTARIALGVGFATSVFVNSAVAQSVTGNNEGVRVGQSHCDRNAY